MDVKHISINGIPK